MPELLPGSSAPSVAIRLAPHSKLEGTLMRRFLLIGFVLALAGLVWAETAKDRFTPAQRRFWSFQPVKKSVPPTIQHPAWIGNPIDAFVGQKLEARGINQNPMADRVTLLRRVTLDLVNRMRPGNPS